MSNFTFLRNEWPELYEASTRAEALAYSDSRTSCFYARRALELAVDWLYRNDRSLRLPYQDHLNALIFEPTFRTAVGPAVFNKAKLIKDLGNQAVHSRKPISDMDALTVVRELFHLSCWLARTYAQSGRPPEALSFDVSLLPKTSPVPPQTLTQLHQLDALLSEKDTRLKATLAANESLDQELKRLRDEVAKAKAANASKPDTHDYSEEETRDYFIDLLLKEVGWPLDKEQDREYPVTGMPNEEGKGFVDYVLWGDDGKPLGLVEAKRTRRDPRIGQRQAELYADCLENQFGQRPIIFYSNGYEHWLWDSAIYPPRSVQGFRTKDELELMIQRRTTRVSLSTGGIDGAIVERYYQTRAIRHIAESFEKYHARKALLVMATGAGKTRTVIALCDLLMRRGWAKRVLFLADRVALVKQAVNAFKLHLPSSSPVNLVTEKNKDGRVYVSTYPTMMGLIDEAHNEEQRKFGTGYFDLVIIDEAHRSVYQRYRAIFEYFDSYLVGLTATPKDEVDRNTYSLFDLEVGVPTDAYGLDEAVKDGYLVPAKAVSVPLKFQRQGIRYEDLSEEDKEQWDALEWSEDGEIPDQVEAEAVNKWLFNKDTVDKVLAHVMSRGIKVAGGDRLGKTIIFAKNHDHAEFIADRFNSNYPHYRGEFARVIDFQVPYAQTLIDDFSNPAKSPHIAISVDMLDTGIDIPEVVNLVFFKLVRSKTKFWQMVGRGTRLCRDLFGPGKHKEYFYIFDYCQNLEFFSQTPDTVDGAVGEALGKRLFKTRLGLIRELDRKDEGHVPESVAIGGGSALYGAVSTNRELKQDISGLLHSQVAAMNLDNFIVRPKRRLVETYSKPEAWVKLRDEDYATLSTDVSGLPTALPEEDEEAKRFDLLMLRLQLALLRSEPGFRRLRKEVSAIAGLLEENSTIPIIREQLPLIQDMQSDPWWEGITAPVLDNARKRLRLLINLIEKAKRQPVYTDFEDEMGGETVIDLPGVGSGTDYERFKQKARQFLRAHEAQVSVFKIRTNMQLTANDIEDLERILIEEGVGSSEELTRAKEESNGLGLFIRSLVGLDRQAAKDAFGRFLTAKNVTGNQVEFINYIIDHLTEHGVMDASLLYESPFTDISPKGPEGVFAFSEVDEIVALLDEIRHKAAA